MLSDTLFESSSASGGSNGQPRSILKLERRRRRKPARKTSERIQKKRVRAQKRKNTIGSPEDKESMVALVLSVPSFLFE